MNAFDPVGALRSLLAYEVDFVLIGGLAARLHGSPTVTDDLGISYSKDRANLERLASCLTEMDARFRLPDPEEIIDAALDWRMLQAADNFTLATDFGAFDCLAQPAGIDSYEGLRERSMQMALAAVTIQVASLDDLMAMKRAVGRPKDRIELEILGALRDELEER